MQPTAAARNQSMAQSGAVNAGAHSRRLVPLSATRIGIINVIVAVASTYTANAKSDAPDMQE